MADINVKILQKQLEGKLSEKASSNQEEQKQEVIKEKYENIIKDENLELFSMQMFFQKVAQRLGFEKEWERYHSENER